jgi:hypothetical protein
MAMGKKNKKKKTSRLIMLGHLIILIPFFPFFQVKTKGQRKAKNSSHKKD